VERPPYWTRARKRIWRDTIVSFKARLVPLVIAVVGAIVGYLINRLYLHMNSALTVAELGLISVGTSYAVFFLGSFAVNTFRVPWLLDAESGQQIDALESRAETAERALGDNQRNKQKHELFGSLMTAALSFSSQLSRCSSDADFQSWDRHFNEWVNTVRHEMTNAGYPTDAAAFARAKETAAPVTGVIDVRSKVDQRRRVLNKYQESLEGFVHRRLP
jgi:hypothetical protein